MNDKKRPITVTATVSLEATGDASLETIARALQGHPLLPFYAGATNPTAMTIVTPTRLHVTAITEQAGDPSCGVCGHADGNHDQDVCQIPDCQCVGARAA